MSRNKPVLVLVLACVWGSEWIGQRALVDLPQLTVMALRCLIGFLVLLPFALRARYSLNAVLLVRSILLGLAVIVAPVLLVGRSEVLSPGMAVLLFAMIPLIATLMERRAGLAGLIYLLGGIGGIAFVARGALSFAGSQLLGVGLVLLAILGSVAGMLRAHRWLYPGTVALSTCLQLVTAYVTFYAVALWREPARWEWHWQSSLWLGLLGVVGSGFGYVLFYRLLSDLRASQASVIQWLIPVIGLVESAIAIRHLPPWDATAGAVIALISAWMMLRLDESEEHALTLQITPPRDRA